MFLFGSIHDKYLSQGIESIKMVRFLLNKKQFRVADSPLSYRSVNEMDSKGLLKDERKNKKGWRSFSLKELIFMTLVKELRSYGLRDIQLKDVSESFFVKPLMYSTDEAILHVLNGAPILVVVNPTGSIMYYTLPNYDAFEAQSVSHIRVNFNEIVMKVWAKLGKERTDYVTNLLLWGSIINDYDLNEQESELMKIIRQKKYKVITVKKNKKEYIVDAEKSDQSNATITDIISMIGSGDFTDVTVQKRDDNIVCVKKTDKFKI
jgi:hypothetical protein